MKYFKPNGITAETFIGTKWIAVGAENTIEFVDKAYCVYSSPNNVKLYTYKISGDKIIINGSTGDSVSDSISYTIKDNTFFRNDTPLYIKE